jgi:mRNA interferase MazF
MMPIQRGEIYFVNLNPVKGREQEGRRPVLVISANAINQRPLVITVVVGTDGANVAKNYPTNVRISTADSGLPIETVFLCFQIRSLDHSRFPPQAAGKVSGAVLQQIENAVRYSLDL